MPYGESFWDLRDEELEACSAWFLLAAHSRPPFVPLYYKFSHASLFGWI